MLMSKYDSKQYASDKASGPFAERRTMSLGRMIGADSFCRWIIIAAVALTLAVFLRGMKISFDLHDFGKPLALTAGIYGFGLLLAWLGAWTRSFVFTGSADFFCSAAQLTFFSTFTIGLQYVVFATNFPLADDAFLRADAALGFDWDKYSTWLAQHPTLDGVFDCAYSSAGVQLFTLFFVHCMRSDDDGNGEFIWCFMITLLIVLAVALPFPALGYPGKIGQQHIDALVAARDGTVIGLDGIVTFPSFHAAVGVLFVYSVRAIKPLLVIAIPLNALLILATPPHGGHYLVDVIAGLVVAGVAIALVRRFRAPRRAADRRSMARPAQDFGGTGVGA